MQSWNMIRNLCLAVLLTAGVACNGGNTVTGDKLDSIGKKIDSTAGVIYDSAKAEAKDLKEKIESRINRKDSADTSVNLKN